MDALYNVYISGIQPARSHEAEAIRDEFSRQFANRTPKLEALLKNPAESCFFANISDQQAQELQCALTLMGLVCKYKPSNHTSDQEFQLAPMEEATIRCPYCNHQQQRPESLANHRCSACGAKMILFERRKRARDGRVPYDSNIIHKPSSSSSLVEDDQAIDIKKLGEQVIEKAEVVTREQRRTRSLYGWILGGTVLAIIAILIFVFLQSNFFRFNKSTSVIHPSSPVVQLDTALPVQKSPESLPNSITEATKQPLLAVSPELENSPSSKTPEQPINIDQHSLVSLSQQRNELIQGLGEKLQVGRALKHPKPLVDDALLLQVNALNKNQDIAESILVEDMMKLNENLTTSSSGGEQEKIQQINPKNGELLTPESLLSITADKGNDSDISPLKIGAIQESISLIKQQIPATLTADKEGLQSQSQVLKNITSNVSEVNNALSANDLIKQIYAMEKFHQSQRHLNKQEARSETQLTELKQAAFKISQPKQTVVIEKSLFQIKESRVKIQSSDNSVDTLLIALNMGLWQLQANNELFDFVNPIPIFRLGME